MIGTPELATGSNRTCNGGGNSPWNLPGIHHDQTLPCPLPCPLPPLPSSIVVGVVDVGGSTTVVGGKVGASQSATGITYPAPVTLCPVRRPRRLSAISGKDKSAQLHH
jgi:hypothetical protein